MSVPPPSREVEVPALRVPQPGQELAALREIRQWVQTREGKFGDGLDRAVTLRELVRIGVADLSTVKPLVPGSGATPSNPAQEQQESPVPPTPHDLAVQVTAQAAILTWSMAPYSRVDYYEVWRADTDALGTAVLVGRPVAQSQFDPLGPDRTAFYWVRARSRSGQYSPFNAVTGVQAVTPPTAEFEISQLEGQIDRSHLATLLLQEIDLISGPPTLENSMAWRVAQESAARATAIAAEASARATAIAAEASARAAALAAEALSRTDAIAAESSARAAAILAEAAARGTAISNERLLWQQGDNQLAQEISLITAGSEASFDTATIWHFDTDAQGWTGSGASVTWNAGQVDISPTGGDPQFLSPAGLTITGSQYTVVKARVTRLAGSGWDGTVFYTTAGHGFSTSYCKTIPLPPSFDVGDTLVLEWDMRSLTAGGTDWVNSVVTRIRIDLGGAADSWRVDWAAVGRNAPGASFAALMTEQAARISGDEAVAAQVTTLAAQVNNATTGLPATRATLLTEYSTTATTNAAIAAAVQALRVEKNTDVATLQASVTSANQARVDGDAANASSIAALSSQVNNPTTGLPATRANLVNNYTTTAGMNTAIATAVQTLRAEKDGDVANLQAAITTVSSARVAGDTANADAINALSAQVNNATTGLPATRATLLTSYSTTATTNAAIASAVQALKVEKDSEVASINAAITSANDARIAGDTANVNAINSLSAQVNNATTGLPATRALLTNSYSTTAAMNAAIASAVNTLGASLTTADTTLQTNINNVAAASVSRDDAIGLRVDSLTSTVNTDRANAQSAVTTLQSTLAAADTAQAARLDVVSASLAAGSLNRDPTIQGLAEFWIGQTAAVTRVQGSAPGRGALRATRVASETVSPWVREKAWIPVSASKTYRASARARVSTGNTGTFYLVIDYRDASGARVATNLGGGASYYPVAQTLTDTWQDFAVLFGNGQTTGRSRPVPAGAVEMCVGVILRAEAAGQWMEAEWIRVEDADLAKAAADLSASITTQADASVSRDNVLSTQIFNVNARLNAGGDVAQSLVNVQTTASAAQTAAGTAQTTANNAGTAAAAAQTTANTASTNATAALNTLADIANDGRLTPVEKQDVRREWDVVASERAGIEAAGNAAGLTTLRSNYTAAFQNLANYLNAGTTWTSGVPSWISDANLGTTTTIVGATFRSTWKGYYDARTALLNGVANKAQADATAAGAAASSAATAAANAQTAANNAQTAANNAATSAATANTLLADIASDSRLTPSEKHEVRREWDIVASERTLIDAQAVTFGITTQRTAYTSATQALANYLNAGAAYTLGSATPPSWIADANLAATTVIVGATFRANWKGYYDAKTALLNAIAAKAKEIADGAQSLAETTASQVTTVQSEIRNGPAAQFEPLLVWDFDSGADGWTATGGTVSATGGVLTFASTVANPRIQSAYITAGFAGQAFDKIRARVRRTGGGGWEGTAYYLTLGHGFSDSYRKTIADPGDLSEWRVLEWDMRTLTAGGSDWITNNIHQIRLDFDADTGDTFEIDWIAVGRRGPGSSYAAVQQEITTRASETGHLGAQYVLRVNAGDLLGGFATAGTSSPTAGATIDFGIQANTFYVAPPVNYSQEAAPTGLGPAQAGQIWFRPSTKAMSRWTGSAWVAFNRTLPFVVKTTTWTDASGVVRDPGVYIPYAVVSDLRVTSANIESVTASKITAGYVNAAIGFNGAKVYGAEFYSGGTVTVTTDAQGNVTNFTANNPTVAIAGGVATFDATAFRVYNGSTGYVPFEVIGGQVRIKTAVIGTILAGQINGAGLTIRSSQPGNRVLLNADSDTPPWVTLSDPATGTQVSLVGPPGANNTVAIRALEVSGDLEASTDGNVVRVRGRGTEIEHITRHADTTYSTNALTDVPGMVFALPVANAVYEIIGSIRVASAATNANMNLQLVGTGTSSVEGYHVAQTTAAAAVQRPLGSAHTAHPVANNTYVTRLHAIVRTGATGGSVKLQAASNGTTTVTLREGSTLELKLRSVKTSAVVQTMQAPAPALPSPLDTAGFYAYIQMMGDGNVYTFNGDEYADVGNWVDAIVVNEVPGLVHQVQFTLGTPTGPNAAEVITLNEAATWTTIGASTKRAGFRIPSATDPATGEYLYKEADVPVTVTLRKVGTTAPTVTFSTTLRARTPDSLAPPI